MINYSLKMHSYNVYNANGSVIARHTGYNLVIMDSSSGAITIQGIGTATIFDYF